jgi:GT2 family glycosyltransferase
LTNLPRSSLIICSRNRRQFLADTVESILAGDEQPSEIVIIDQSDCPNPSFLERWITDNCVVRYQWEGSRGVSRARNSGMRASSHDLLVFTDDDVWVTPSWFAVLTRAVCQAGPRSVVTGQVRYEEMLEGVPLAINTKEDPTVYSHRVAFDVLFTGNMATYRTSLEMVGGFDERLGPGTAFPAAEDNDLGFRLLEAGYQIVYAPAAVVYHRAWRTERDYLMLRWRYAVGQGGFYAKHMSLHDWHMLMRMRHDIGRRVRRLPQRLCWRDRRGTAHDAVYVLGILYGASRWLLHKRM